ncbi:bifunctional ADP-dependent NAD(P)H-hydrate dehydratase/NAD(P)H-hydrate epimerase [Rhizorhabdus dicambivorans]|uniref:Bifunctional NAD(P)H-hydrate repair enzyme n=1 Tax=Rhizorhabdus dicambivorans TaxID=1850238 RepID=A0A2A4FUS2_9SPHN|nr:bifunctional ADP-dependent NAD(P)H-hydrate dehydratase/NAD(P)H-hydrate epimerase [Rhizorhabdus dicambivorans]ATE65594.1 bifunctional ADP-dependent NAD(P)H-hydrate dehydratase/NAD(P)H-hydrate epimerase [Rhizorhabdus dicambivorans]PCE41937.1 bifunctional ADP-dependent NAD(P)H-hydrate dehydratase/NAD(P)H-hydrate epimerase [Rhizorhabdus dicambivorans]
MSARTEGRPILTAAETRAAEEAVFATGLTVDAAMQRAGAAVAEAAWRYAGRAPTLVLCGPGNNGGDGYVIARLLHARGVPVRIAASGEPRTDVARVMRGLWGGPVEPLAEAKPAAVIIDALFGTGLARPLDPAIAAPLERLAAAARLRIAVDLPSGIGTDDGALLGPAIRYDMTVALAVLKPAHLLQPAAALMGRLVLGDIGIPGTSSLSEIARPHLPAPGPADHKYTRGHVVVAEGAMPGAALLSAMAAQRGGAGYVTLAGKGQGGPAAIVRRDAPLADLLADRRVGCALVGPGLGRDAAGRALLDAALASDKPLVLDADALMLLEGTGALPGLPVLTPHEGEFATLFGTLEGSRIERARAAAAQAQAVVVLKGPDTVVAAPDGRAAIGWPAPGWLASAGTGDVLAGLIAANRARGLAAFEAACAGVWLHRRAAELAGPGLIADDLIAHLPKALSECSWS